MLLELGLEVGELSLERLDLGQEGLHECAYPEWSGLPLRRIDPEWRRLIAHCASMQQ